MFLSNWTRFFGETGKLLEECELRYNGANAGYAEYVLERLNMCITTCQNLHDSLEESNHPDLREYEQSLTQLITCLRSIHSKWLEQESQFESNSHSLTDRSSMHSRQRRGRGRPQFDVSKDQIVYLRSLSLSGMK